MDLSSTHIHLLLNHFPTIGFIIGLALFVGGLIARSDHIKVASLVILAGIALLTIPAYVSGNAAQENLVNSNADVSAVLMDMHEGAALLSLLLMQITGAFAWLGLWQYRHGLHLRRWTVAVVLVFGVLTFGAVSRAASLGGEIRHTEIRVTQESPAEQLGRTIGNYVRDTPAAWVACEALHFVGLSLLIGVMLVVDLRALGFMKAVPFSAVDRLLPWALLGFGINVVTGMLFFAASPGQYANNPAFYWKMVFLLAAGANTLYFFFDRGWASAPGMDTPVFSKLVASSALFLWIGVLFWGSMLPFIGNAF